MAEWIGPLEKGEEREVPREKRDPLIATAYRNAEGNEVCLVPSRADLPDYIILRVAPQEVVTMCQCPDNPLRTHGPAVTQYCNGDSGSSPCNHDLDSLIWVTCPDEDDPDHSPQHEGDDLSQVQACNAAMRQCLDCYELVKIFPKAKSKP